MVKKDVQEQEIEEITPESEIEALEEEAVVPNENPTEEIKTPEAVESPETQISGRYVSYKQEASEGVLDRETNKLLPDLDSQMAEVLNKLDNIMKTTG